MILLGNLTAAQIAARLGVEFNQEVFDFLDATNQSEVNGVNVAVGKWHGFDIPFLILAGDYETAKKITAILSPLAKQFNKGVRLNISVSGNGG